jgi:hypothetical protein
VEELRSILTGTLGIVVAAALAIGLGVARRHVTAGADELRAASRVALAATGVQALHFAEELATGFARRFPELLGLAPWSARFFVTFNLFWLAVWLLCSRALPARRTLALVPLWFLGLAALANGVVHPLLALRAGGYFPGLISSPFVAVAGAILLGRLLRITRPDAA